MSRNCDIPLWAIPGGESPPPPPPPGAPDFAGIHMLDGYAGTVNVKRSPKVGTVEITSGTIAQSDPVQVALGNGGGTITVTSTFSWTGGNINAGTTGGTYAGTITLASTATGLAEPVNSGTVSLGSTISLLGTTTAGVGSILTIANGMYDITRGDGFVLGDNATLWIDTNPTKAPVPALADGQIFDVVLNKPIDIQENKIVKNAEKGYLVIGPKDPPPANARATRVGLYAKGALLENKGKVEIIKNTELRFGKGDGENDHPLGYRQIQTDETKPSTTIIEAGCSISSQGTGYVDIDGGTLQLKETRDSTGQIIANKKMIRIDAEGATKALVIKNVNVTHTKIDEAIPLLLDIKGNFEMDGSSTINMLVDRTTKNVNDKIEASGTVKFLGLSWIKAQWFTSTGGTAGNGDWTLVESKATVQAPAKPINIDPNFQMTPTPGNQLELDATVTDYITEEHNKFGIKIS